jgi:hypothetical protein
MTAFATPVVLFVFNRPAKLRRLLGVLERVRPTQLLVVADGPRADHPEDAAACAEVRALVERPAWPCEVRRHYAAVNMGCDPRIASGIDWAFGEVEEAIFLEDDLLPDPSFFPWCAEMLARYRGAPGARANPVLQVAGRNELAQWEGTGGDHHLVRRASLWGWASWRSAWRSFSRIDLPGDAAAIADQAAAGRLDPLVADHFVMLNRLAEAGEGTAWDYQWTLRQALVGALSVVPPVNLVANAGFGAGATHTRFAPDLRGLLPVFEAPAPVPGFMAELDPHLDRWSLLLDLMATYREPATLARLARVRGKLSDHRLRHHLAPFAMGEESLAALRHLRRFVSDPAALDPLIALLQGASP